MGITGDVQGLKNCSNDDQVVYIWWNMKSNTPVDENAVIIKAFISTGEALGLDDIELSAILDDHVFTIMLIRQGNQLLQLGPEARSRALLLIHLHQSLLAVVGNEQNARDWLCSHNDSLCGRPCDLITSHAGIEQVVQYLTVNRALI